MVRSLRFPALILMSTLAATAVAARGDDKPADTRPAPQPEQEHGTASDKAQFYLLLGEDPAQPFVPLKPRTVEERKHLDAVLDYGVAPRWKIAAIGPRPSPCSNRPSSSNPIRSPSCDASAPCASRSAAPSKA